MTYAGLTPAVVTGPPFNIGYRYKGFTDRMGEGDCHAMPAELPDGIGAIDPFLGSGTTAVACAEPGVPFIGYEIVEEYAEMANERVKEQKR